MRQVSHKRGGDDNGTGRHLAEGYAVHERLRVHPAPNVNDLLEHERQGSKAPSKSKEVDLHHEKGKAEKGGTEEVEKNQSECENCEKTDNGDGGNAFFWCLCLLRLRCLPQEQNSRKGRAENEVERAYAESEGSGRGGRKQDVRVVLQGASAEGVGRVRDDGDDDYLESGKDGFYPGQASVRGIDRGKGEHEQEGRKAEGDIRDEGTRQPPHLETHVCHCLHQGGAGYGLGQHDATFEALRVHPFPSLHDKFAYVSDHGRSAEGRGAKAEEQQEKIDQGRRIVGCFLFFGWSFHRFTTP